jgi:uncharacterized protein (TIGR03067 family)
MNNSNLERQFMFDGTWIPVTATMNGEALPVEVLQSTRVLFTGEKYLATVNDIRDYGTFKWDVAAKPPTVTITGVEGPNAGRTMLAIYQFDHDRLTVCYDLQGLAFPTEFKAEAGSGLYLVTYRRMKRITGLGGVFFKAQNSAVLRAWYQQHLGIQTDDYGGGTFGTSFNWREYDEPETVGNTIWSIFARASNYFDQPLMLNYRVENLDAVLDELRAAGVWLDDKREDSEYGRFAWIKDGEGNRIELWQPPKGEVCA